MDNSQFFMLWKLDEMLQRYELQLREEYGFHQPELQRIREAVCACTRSINGGYEFVIDELHGTSSPSLLEYVLDKLVYGEIEADIRLLRKNAAFLKEMDLDG